MTQWNQGCRISDSDLQIFEIELRLKNRSRWEWLVRTPDDIEQHAGGFYALITVCTHLGCTPSWLEGERKFKCPCHGSGFYITGINFEGPAPRPLERAGIRLAEDGMLEVDKSIKFQEEMGQWNDTTSFYEVVG